MIRINLLPVRAAQKKEAMRGQLAIAGLSLVAVVLACGGVYASMAMKISAEQEAIAAKQDEINRLKKTIGEVAHFKKLQAELQEKLTILAKLKEGKTGPVRLLDELSAALSEKLWLTSFKEAGGAVTIVGYGLNEETVAVFMRNLEASPYFKNVELQVIEQTPPQNDAPKLHKFDLTCVVETPASRTANK